MDIMTPIMGLIMVSRSPLLQGMEPLLWDLLWSVSRAGAGLLITPPLMEVTSATESLSRRDSVSLLSVWALLDLLVLREGMDCLAEMVTRALLEPLASEERLETPERMVPLVFLEEMGRTDFLDPRVLQERTDLMAMLGLLVPLDCLVPRDRPELLDPEGGLETRELMDLLAHQGHQDPRARMVAMDPLALLDLLDSMETLDLRD